MSNDKVISDWVKDGTATSEPVTVETPAPEGVVADPVVSGDKPRDPETGQFVPKASATEAPQGATATPPAGTAETPAPPAPGASAQAIQDMLESRLGDQPFQLPKNVHVPLKRGDAVEYVPLDDVLKGGMRERDYTLKTMELANERRRVAAEEARLKARETHIAEQEAMYKDALKDPQKMQQFEGHLAAYESNPLYRKMVDEALDKRMAEAELNALRADDERAIVQDAANLAFGWVSDFAKKYPEVDPDTVRAEYSRALSLGTATLDPRAVEAIYQNEVARAERYRAPLSSQIESLKAELAKLTAAKQAEQHNAQTTHVLTRGKAPPTAPVGGAPPAPALPKPGERFHIRDLSERNAAWAKQG